MDVERGAMDDHLTIPQAAERLGLSAKAVQRRIERGSIQSLRRDGRRLIPAGELDRLEAQETPQGNVPLADMLARLEALAAENGRFRALAEVAETTEQRLTDELHQARTRITELEAQNAEQQTALALAERPRRRWRRQHAK